MAGMEEEAEEAMPPAREGDCIERKKTKKQAKWMRKIWGTENVRKNAIEI